MIEKNKRKGMRQYSFFFEKKMPFEIVTIVGASRCGKTLLGRLIGTLRGVEYIDEPWLSMMLPVIQGEKLIQEDIASDMLRAFSEEMFYDMILLRRANFRPFDRSSIWPLKSPEELIGRLMDLRSRRDAQKYAKKNRSVLLSSPAGTYPFLKFLVRTFPSGKVIHIVRNGIDVALEVAEKQWFSDSNLRCPFDSCLYFTYRSKKKGLFYLPWWVQAGEEEDFLSLGGLGRGFYFWRRMLELNQDNNDRVPLRKPGLFMEIKFEEVIREPLRTIKRFSAWIGRPLTPATKSQVESIDPKIADRYQEADAAKIPQREISKVNFWLGKYGYPVLRVRR